MKATQIVWSEEFAVGDGELDGEHRRLVELINMIYVAGTLPLERKEIGSRLNGLLKCAQEHFTHENSILTRINRSPIPSDIDRPGFIRAMIAAAVDKHIANHATSLQQLSSIIREIRAELASGEPTLGTDLKDWFIGHATVHDAHLRPIFKALNRSIV